MNYSFELEMPALRKGSGNGDPKDGLCLLQMVDYFSGSEKVTDTPSCACPVLTALGIRLNDLAPSQKARDSLWPLVWLLLGSRAPKAERERTEHIVREVTHRIIAPLFDARWPENDAALRQANTMAEIKIAAYAAAAATCAANAAADATYAANAATYAANAAAYAATCATNAAANAAANAAYAATCAPAWFTLRDIFIEAIALGKHGEEDPVYIPRAEQLVKVLENAR